VPAVASNASAWRRVPSVNSILLEYGIKDLNVNQRRRSD
jgi:hypothetical protein